MKHSGTTGNYSWYLTSYNNMRATKIKAEYIGQELRKETEHIFHMVEAGNNIILFPCYNGEVMRYENIHSFLEEWRLVEKL